MNVRAFPIFVLLMIPMLGQSQEVWGMQDPQLDSLNEIVDRYRDFREGVWMLNPPIHQTENESALDEKSTSGTWFEAAWTRWLVRPGWFMRHSGSAGTFSPELQNAIWPKDHTGSLLVWEHPGQGRVYLSLEDPLTGEAEELFYVDATDWTLRSSESVLQFYERELATRRVVQVFRSPYAEPEPEPEPRMMMMGVGSPQFRVVLDSVSPELVQATVEFGEETATGPLTVWRLDGSLVDGWNLLPGQAFPALWLADRGPGDSLSFSFDPGEEAGAPDPMFLRATLGMVDSDNDGMDDGWELWHFDELVDPDDDADNDGLTNLQEYLLGTDPTNPDTSGNGFTDGFEYANGGNPVDGTDGGQAFLIVTGDGDQDEEIIGHKTYTLYPNSGSYLVMVYVYSEEFPYYTGEQSQFNDQLRWEVVPSHGGSIVGSVSVNALHDDWVESDVSGSSFLEYAPIAMQGFGVIPSHSEDIVTVEVEIGVTNIGDGALPSTAILAFLPLNVAPEVVRMNGNFDQGRLDPQTGFALRDCDVEDLIAERDSFHDPAIKQGKIVTKDLHRTFFGMRPDVMPEGWEEDATITIQKLDQIDPDTDRPESGEIRLHAIKDLGQSGEQAWVIQLNEGLPEDPQPKNLVSQLYGPHATIPKGDGVTYWMEGITPGKITLEYTYTKGALTFTQTQTFRVVTEQSKAAWQQEVRNEILLETLGQIDINNYEVGGGHFFAPLAKYFALNKSNILAVYGHYQKIYTVGEQKYLWAGLAKLAGAPVYAGLSDAQWVRVGGYALPAPMQGVPINILKDIQSILVQANIDIFHDLAWQFAAHRCSGIDALKYVRDQNELLLNYPAWQVLDEGVFENDSIKISLGNIELLRREQQNILALTYQDLDAMGFGLVSWMFSILAENPVPGGPKFSTAVPNGNIANFEDRWVWITDENIGMWKFWMDATLTIRNGWVQIPLRNRANQYTKVPLAPVW